MRVSLLFVHRCKRSQQATTSCPLARFPRYVFAICGKIFWYSQYRPLQDEHFARVLTADRLPPDRIHRATARFRLIVLANADLRLPAFAAAALSTLAHLRSLSDFKFVHTAGHAYARRDQLGTSSFTRYTALHTRAIHTIRWSCCLSVGRAPLFLANLPLPCSSCPRSTRRRPYVLGDSSVRVNRCDGMDVISFAAWGRCARSVIAKTPEFSRPTTHMCAH